MGIDERLRSELERLAEHSDPRGAFERVARRRTRRRSVRRLEAAALTVAVIAGTLAGTYALSRVFRTGSATLTPGGDLRNGKIAFVTYDSQSGEEDIQSQIYVVDPDGSGLAKLADVDGTVGSMEWSPDGRTLAIDVDASGVPGEQAGIHLVNGDGSEMTQIAGRGATSPTWSPDGSKIAYTDTWQDTDAIFVMDANGSNRARVTDETMYVATPDWSPDGSRIAFASEEPNVLPEFWDLFVIDLATSSLRQLTDHPSFDFEPEWSPDGSKILFVSRRDAPSDQPTIEGDWPEEIYVMNADGSNQTRLTHDMALDQGPVWSPDGAKIAFESFRSDDELGIYVMNADGTDARLISPVNGYHPAWQPIPVGTGDESSATTPAPTPSATDSPSPSGDTQPGAFEGRVVYQDDDDLDGRSDIFVLDGSTGDVTNLTNDHASDETPAWSPDGSKIAFSSDRDNPEHFDIFVMNADGTGVSRLTDLPGDQWNPSWSPDGARIAFSAEAGIYTMDEGGGDVRELVTAITPGDPSWSPDGSRIVFTAETGDALEGTAARHLFIIGADGTGLQQLTQDPDLVGSDPDWSPDGRTILFTSGRDVYVVNADGTGLTNLTESEKDFYDRDASWSLDGRQIVFASTRDEGDAQSLYVMNADGTSVRRILHVPIGFCCPLPDWGPAG